MNDDQFNDLKQFIAATVSQATAGMATKEDLKRLVGKVDDLDLKIDTLSEALHETLNEHDSRITKLEQQAL